MWYGWIDVSWYEDWGWYKFSQLLWNTWLALHQLHAMHKFACCARILHEIWHAVHYCEHAKNWNRQHISKFCWPAKIALLHENNFLKDIEESQFVFWIACRGLIGYIFTQLQMLYALSANCQKLGGAVYATPYLLYWNWPLHTVFFWLFVHMKAEDNF